MTLYRQTIDNTGIKLIAKVLKKLVTTDQILSVLKTNKKICRCKVCNRCKLCYKCLTLLVYH